MTCQTEIIAQSDKNTFLGAQADGYFCVFYPFLEKIELHVGDTLIGHVYGGMLAKKWYCLRQAQVIDIGLEARGLAERDALRMLSVLCGARKFEFLETGKKHF